MTTCTSDDEKASESKKGIIDELDYEQIDIPKGSPRMSVSGVNSQALAWLVVGGYLLKKSISGMVRDAIYSYLKANRQDHLRMLTTEAKQRGVTLELAFDQILKQSKE